jgi:hypothetical protein
VSGDADGAAGAAEVLTAAELGRIFCVGYPTRTLRALGFEVDRGHAYSPQEAVAFGAAVALHCKGLGGSHAWKDPLEAWVPAVDAVLIADAETAHGWLAARPGFAMLVDGPEQAARVATGGSGATGVVHLAPLWEAVT